MHVCTRMQLYNYEHGAGCGKLRASLQALVTDGGLGNELEKEGKVKGETKMTREDPVTNRFHAVIPFMQNYTCERRPA